MDPRAPVGAVIAHARSVPVAEREAFAEAVAALDLPLVVVRTCHRVEAFAASDSAAPSEAALAAISAVAPAGVRVVTGEDAVRHVIRVATGRDSVVLGEDQVLHQVRVALRDAQAAGPVPAVLERVFAAALRAGRRSRSWLPERPRSLADHALAWLAERPDGSLEGRDLLVVGAGSMGTLLARAGRRAGARVLVANRTASAARALARAVDGRAVALNPGQADIELPEAIALAIRGPWEVGDATRDHLLRSAARVVDLSVPPAVDARLAGALGDRLLDADGLAAALEAGAAAAIADPGWTRRVDRLIDGTTAEVLDWLTRDPGRDAARALRERADDERRAELARLYRRRPGLGPADREAIERMTEHLAARILDAPLERLGRDADGDAGRLVRDLFAL